MNSYLSYSKQARSLWKNLYKASDQGERPHQEAFEFAKHVSELRNKLALEITEHLEKYSQPLDRLSQRTRDLMETHSQQFKKSIEDKIKKERVLNTQDWRMTLKAEQSEKTLSPVSLEPSKNLKNSKVEKRSYFDKAQVLNYALGHAEEILSELLSGATREFVNFCTLRLFTRPS